MSSRVFPLSADIPCIRVVMAYVHIHPVAAGCDIVIQKPSDARPDIQKRAGMRIIIFIVAPDQAAASPPLICISRVIGIAEIQHAVSSAMSVRSVCQAPFHFHIPPVSKHIRPDAGSTVRLRRKIRPVRHLIDQAAVVDFGKALPGTVKMQQKFLFPRHPGLHDNLLHIFRHQHHGQTVFIRLNSFGIILLRLKDRSAYAALPVRAIREKRSVEHFRKMLVRLIHQPFGIHNPADGSTGPAEVKIRPVIGACRTGTHIFNSRQLCRFLRLFCSSGIKDRPFTKARRVRRIAAAGRIRRFPHGRGHGFFCQNRIGRPQQTEYQ